MKLITILELQISGPRVPQSHIYHLQSIMLTRIGIYNLTVYKYIVPEDHTGMQLQDALIVTLEQWTMEIHCHSYRQCQQHQTSMSITEVEEIKLLWSQLDLVATVKD